MRILLIGKSGQLGGDLLRNNESHDILAPDRGELDITVPATVAAATERFRPDFIINTAAFHDLPRCEEEPGEAFRVNCAAVRDLAHVAREWGARLVTFSSDYVFGGDKRTPYGEEDPPRPLQMYGISRAAGEFAALAAAPERSVIIRTCGLYGASGARSKGGNFVEKRLAEAGQCGELEMGCDQTVSPTSTDDLSRAVLKLIEHPQLTAGIYHLVNEGECSWYEFTRAIYEIAGVAVKVKPVNRGGMSGTMRRPLYSVLANRKGRALGIVLPHWRDALERYLSERQSRT